MIVSKDVSQMMQAILTLGPGGAGAMRSRPVANSASVRVEPSGLVWTKVPLHFGHWTDFPSESVRTVKERPQDGQAMTFLC